MPDFCFMKLSTWPLKTVDSFENLKCNAFTFLPHRWAYDVMYYKKNWHDRFWNCQWFRDLAVHLWCLSRKPEGGRRIKRDRNYIYIFFFLQPAFYYLLFFSFQGLDRAVPGEVKERHTCMLERQRASKGKRREDRQSRNMTEAEESSQGVSKPSIIGENRMSCSEATVRIKSVKKSRNEELLLPVANKCTLNFSN